MKLTGFFRHVSYNPVCAVILACLLFGCSGGSGDGGENSGGGGAPGGTGSVTLDACGAPVFTPGEGTFSLDQNVIITTSTTGAIIHYTTNGDVPTESSPAYTGPVAVSGNGTTRTIKAVVVKTGMSDSVVTTGTFSINYNKVSTPQFSAPSGWYSGTQEVKLTCQTIGAIVRYTTDGSTPVPGMPGHGIVYNGESIPVADTMTLKAIAYRTGMLISDVVTSNVHIRRVIIATAHKTGTSRFYRITVLDNAGNVDSAGWNKMIPFGIDGDPLGQIHNFAIDSQNNVYVIGAKNHDSGTEIADGFVKKYAGNGTEITSGWDKKITGISHELDNPYGDVDSSDNLYIIGTQDQQWIVKKYDSSGTEVTSGWNKKFGHTSYGNKGSGQNIRVHRLTDAVYAVGFAGWGGGSSYAWVRGFNSDGSDLSGWDKIAVTPDESGARSIAFQGTSYVYIGGFANDTVSHDRYAALFKYDTAGTLHWNKHYFNGWCWAGSIRNMDVDTDGYVYLKGIKKLASDGTEISSGWPKSSLLGSQALDAQNNIYAADEVHGTHCKDWRLYKYASGGTLLWTVIIPGGDIPNGDEANVAIAVFR